MDVRSYYAGQEDLSKHMGSLKEDATQAYLLSETVPFKNDLGYERVPPRCFPCVSVGSSWVDLEARIKNEQTRATLVKEKDYKLDWGGTVTTMDVALKRHRPLSMRSSTARNSLMTSCFS